MERSSYEEILSQLSEAALWLAGTGSTKKQNRIHVHISNISRLVEARKAGSLQELVKRIGQTQLLWSLVEAIEFTDAYAALRDYEPTLLKRKFLETLKGPTNPLAETGDSNRGRNTIFELNLAGRLYRKGLPIHLPANPDILCEFNWARLYIQCKRPFAETGVQRNILDARRQVTRDIGISEDISARGLIAISVSRILNPGDKLLVTRTEAEVGEKLADEIQSAGERHAHQWKRISDKQVVGILFHMITPAFIEGAAILTAAEQVVMFALPHASDADQQLLRDLLDLLRETL